MELHTKQFTNLYEQCRSSPTLPPHKMRATELADSSQTAKQNKSLHGGTAAHMKNIK